MADLREQLQAGLADRYRIERELGRGGMATVFLAHDHRHDRAVALKVLHPELAATLGPERFQREIRTAAKLQHPHILTLLDSGQVAGQLWFTMPYVEGESLRDLLRREVQLSVNVAIQIARELALALDYAHRQGVVHRDIKPENVLLSDGQALIADFGVAKALGEAGDQLTATGLAIGTPAYMSPEQASGDSHVDARSDIYSTGCVLYEMLAGEPPYTGTSPQAVIAKRFAGPLPSLRVVRPDVSTELEAAICKALALVPAARFSTAGEFSNSLIQPGIASLGGRRKVAASRRTLLRAVALMTAALATVIGAITLGPARDSTPQTVLGDAKLVAVLPFENLGRSEDDYFADGVADAIRGKLAALPGLQVIARTSSGQYRGTTKSAAEIARELGVQYLLTGTVTWVRDSGGSSRVRVSPELVQVGGQSMPITKWQEPFDAVLSDVFEVQTDIAGRVAQALDVTLGMTERRALAADPTNNLAAYDAYLRGEEVSDSFGTIQFAALRRAAAAYSQAVALDSGFAMAWARLSQVHSLLYFNIEATPDQAAASRTAADRALALAPNGAEGRLALGDYYANVLKDPQQALMEYRIAQRTAPNDVDVLTGLALAERTLGAWKPALWHHRQAQALDPRSVSTIERLAETLLLLRRYPDALAATDRGLGLAPANLFLRELKAIVYLSQGDLEEARAVIRATPPGVEREALVAYLGSYGDLYWLLDDEQQRLLLGLSPRWFDNSRAEWGRVLAQTYGLRGDWAKARAYADSAASVYRTDLQGAPNDPQKNALLGVTLAFAGDTAEAIRLGERAVALVPIHRNQHLGPYVQHQLVRIHLLVGDPEKALDRLEPLLKVPYMLSPGLLRVDPSFRSLQGNPRFERLAKGA